MTTTERESNRILRKETELEYQPRYWSLPMHNTLVRWIVLVIHRRGGKTTAALNHLQRAALNNPNTRYAYIAPTYKQAKRIVWKMAKFYAKGIDGVKFNEAELLITYANGSEIMILGSDNPDSLRGIALWGCFLDEYPLQSPIVFTEIVTKCLADHQGFCIFGGTPNGKGHFYKVYQVAKSDPEWCLVYRTIDQSLAEESGETIDMLRRSLEDDRALVKNGIMTPEEFEQEWYNSFDAAVRGAVYLREISKAQEEGRIRHCAWVPGEMVYTVWDLGVSKSDAMAIGFYQKVAGETRMIDYYENTGLGLVHYAKVVKEKPYVYGRHFAPHDIKAKELVSGKTRQEGAAKLGIIFDVTPSQSIEDGIDAGRQFWNGLFVDPKKCEVFLDLVGQYRYAFDEKTGQFTPTPIHNFTSHAADVHRYAALVEDMMVPQEFAVPKKNEQPLHDDYMGDLEVEDESRAGFGKSPTMKGVNIGALGHKPPEQT